MLKKQRISIVALLLMSILSACSTSRTGFLPRSLNNSTNDLSQRNYVYSPRLYQIRQNITEKISDLNADAEVLEVHPNLYDVRVNLKVNLVDLHNLMNSNVQTETVAVLLGVMIFCAATVNEETAVSADHFRNLIFFISDCKFAQIPIADCRHFSYWVKNKDVDKVVEKFFKHAIVYRNR